MSPCKITPCFTSSIRIDNMKPSDLPEVLLKPYERIGHLIYYRS